MLGRLKNRLFKAAGDSDRDDLMAFSDSVAGLNREAVLHMLVLANALRLTLAIRHKLELTAYLDGEPVSDQALYPEKIACIVKALQKSKARMAARAMMIWLHSAKAVGTPALRVHGRDLWAELAKGLGNDGEIALARAQLSWLKAIDFPDGPTNADCLYIPRMLNPHRPHLAHIRWIGGAVQHDTARNVMRA
ncbi:hypothetical protein ERD78_19295 [Allopusillimonas soli]|uniref:Uncharacterized protein n=1 Tax=Allopusillimonas soli TaxID=659016 RepID=A0A853FKU5_9BURK|nr:hypothetical protein [Allopusillimonas soli]NYT38991.1 hypothetical protein [Allopusillimonas soli]TEA69567.1 hypothetical protein ERD78_19295 [Allopusillimonas soli]